MGSLMLLMLLLAGTTDLLAAEAAHDTHGHGVSGHRDNLPVYWVIPFAGMLLSIAVFPLVRPHFWHQHYGKVTIFWSLVMGIPFLIFHGKGGRALYEIMHIVLLDYVPFIILLLALFTAAGGICLKGSLRGSPAVNTLLLLIGTVLASWMGTTGAAMLLIRPILRANAWRKHRKHVVIFFIFLVANIGGSLTPLGDPPLFLGFLKGVDFFWTMKLLPVMLPVSIALLIIFFCFDTWLFRKEGTPPEDGVQEPLRMEGKWNFLLIAAIIGSILFSTWAGKNWFTKPTIAEHHRGIVVETTDGRIIKGYSLSAKKSETDLKIVTADGQTNTVALASIKTRQSPEKPIEPSPLFHVEGLRDVATTNLVAFVLTHGDQEFDEAKLKEDEAKEYNELRETQFAAVKKVNALRGTISHDESDGIHLLDVTVPYTNLLRDGLLLLIAFLSMRITPMYKMVKDEHGHDVPAEGEEETNVRAANGFTWEPIREVAKLFAGIFVCMIPAILILKAGTEGALGVVINAVMNPDNSANNMMYFWFTGTLSSFLDNAPTYVVFFNTAGGDPATLMGPMAQTLLAISCGAVFMGANTYIGNAPNFMVKSIAEEKGVEMPSFFGYMGWSILFLIPVFIIVTFYFF
jgi:Na+/H+ antiporter NhaD/arsenite permease-like protein